MTRTTVLRSLLAAVAAVAMVVVAAPTATAAPVVKSGEVGHWIGAWGTAVQEPVPGFFLNWAPDGFDNQSIRQVIRVTTGGVALRVLDELPSHRQPPVRHQRCGVHRDLGLVLLPEPG